MSKTNGPRTGRGRAGRRAAALAVAASAAAVVTGVPAVALAAPAAPLHPTGLLRPATSVSVRTGLDRLATSASAAGGAVRAESVLPPAVDLTGFAVPPGDQGQLNSCVSWATAYTIGGWESNYGKHAGAPFGPLFVYNQVNGGQNQGTYFDDNFRVLQQQGDLEAADWTQAADDYTDQPTAEEQADAALHVMSPATTLFASSTGFGIGADARTAIETALADNRPVALGLPIYLPFEYLDEQNSTFTAADASGALMGYHAVAALGYDANGVVVENSWGSSWGDHGFATLSWDFVERYVDEAYAAGSFSANGLTPSVTGLSGSTVSTTGGGALDVRGLRLLNVDTTKPTAVVFASVADPSVQVTARAVTKTSSGLRVLAPDLAAGQWRVVVTGLYGASAPNGTADVVNAVATPSISLPTGFRGSTTSGSTVVVTGSGFGATWDDFATNGVGVTVGGSAVDSWNTQWVDDSHLLVWVAPEPAGTTLPLAVTWGDGRISSPATIAFGQPAPVVTKVSPSRIPVAGTSRVTVTVADGSTLGLAPRVTLVSKADPAVRLAATVTSRTATTVTVTVPPAPRALGQDVDVLVSGPGGTSAALAADVLGYRTPIAAHPAAAVVAANGGSLTLTGTGFGTSATAFAAQHITATVGGKAAPVRWVSSTSVSVTVPAGTPGQPLAVVLLHDTVPGPAATGVRYGAVITRNSVPAGSRTGWTTTLTGVGFARSGGWVLVTGTGKVVASLPVVATQKALSGVRSGVWIGSATSVVAKLPGLAPGAYSLRFVPSAATYPGAVFLGTSSATVVYR